MRFDMHAKVEISSDKNLMKNYFNKRALLASGLHEVIFLSGNPNELFDRLRLKFQQKQAGNDNTRFEREIIAIVDNLLEHKSFTPKQH